MAEVCLRMKNKKDAQALENTAKEGITCNANKKPTKNKLQKRSNTVPKTSNSPRVRVVQMPVQNSLQKGNKPKAEQRAKARNQQRTKVQALKHAGNISPTYQTDCSSHGSFRQSVVLIQTPIYYDPHCKDS